MAPIPDPTQQPQPQGQPQQPTAQAQPQSQPQPQTFKPSKPAPLPMSFDAAKFLPVIAIIIIIAVAGVAYMSLSSQKASSTTTLTTTITTTVQQAQINRLTHCTTISSPGVYYLSQAIATSQISSCIVINSSGVSLIGDNFTILGDGPYASLPPFTYGIEVLGASNVTITNVNVRNFSYGVYFSGTSGSSLIGSNLSNNEGSGIFLLNSNDNKVLDDYVSASLGTYGGIGILNSTSNLVENTTDHEDARYGIVINSTGNSFTKDSFTGSPTDVYCPLNGYSGTSLFSNSDCATNEYCSFAQCSTTNIPPQVSAINLPTDISTCGAISTPGAYLITSNLNLAQLLNLSNPLAKTQACITISSPYVSLNCDHHTIQNADTGISLLSIYENVSNCVLYNDTYGVTSTNNFDVNLRNVSMSDGIYGEYLDGVSSGLMSNVSITGYKYGAYLNSTLGIIFNAFNASGNTYGIYVVNSTSNVYENSKALSNTDQDLYCDVNSYNSSTNVFQNFLCRSTDCQWANSCPQLNPPPLNERPITQCTTIQYPGNYSMTSNMIGTGNCMTIDSSNVVLYCNNHVIHGFSGSAIYVNGQSNVSISDCQITNYPTGINITNTKKSSFTNMSFSQVAVGVSAYNDNGTTFKGINVTEATGSAGFLLSKVSDSRILNSTSTGGLRTTTGFDLQNSYNDTLMFDSALQNPAYGFQFANSTNNLVSNDIASGNNVDYYCSPSSSGIYAERGGIDNGVTKTGCHWLVEQNTVVGPVTCAAISASATIDLTTDFVYSYGGACFSVFNGQSTSGSNTTINCQDHTVLSNSGGAFVDIKNASSVIVENCYLKNFASGVELSGYNQQILNDTIVGSTYGIYANSSYSSTISKDTILNSTYGIYARGVFYSTMSNNNVSSSTTGIYVDGGNGDKFLGNNATYDSKGLSLLENSQSLFQNNIFGSTNPVGIVCDAYSGNTESQNIDLGGNVCGVNSNCDWMTSSGQCKPS